MKNSILLLVILFQVTSLFSQWIEQTSGVSVSLNSVHSPSSNEDLGWICGDNGTVLRTSNGGTNWINVSSGIPANTNLKAIFSMLPNRVLVSGINAGGSAVIYMSSNNGASWQNTFNQSGINVYGFGNIIPVLFIGSPAGGRWTIYKSENYGTTWDSTGLYLVQAGNESGFYNSVYSLEGKFWFGTNNTRIYYSNSGGATWSTQSTTPEVNSISLGFSFLLVEDIGYGLTGGTNISKTTDLGVNWNPVSTPGSGDIKGLAVSWGPTAICWYIKGNVIYAGTNGSNFTQQYTAPSGSYNHISTNGYGGLRTWAVRDNGGISKYTGGLGIQLISNTIPEKFSLSQNYPNPFNPSTKFRFQIPVVNGRDRSKLTIYDLLGKEVTTLVNENLAPGTYEVDWNASNYSSGIYYYQLNSGDLTESKKMILVK
ncbi:MAG: T9SS type A sorting domain-containing protein [Ignavibacteria bacterium]|nr:T9SS type A sorting domain-containing protein [Ignavibacteria bacterium]